MNIKEFLFNYFGKTITLDYGYNWINTITYVFLALFIYFVLLYKLVKKLKIKLNTYFFAGIALFVSFGSMLRVMEEPYSSINIFTRSANPLNIGFYFITPGIYFLILFLILIIFLLSIIIEKYFYVEKEKTIFFTSLIFFIPTFIFMVIKMTFSHDFFIYLFSILLIAFVLRKIFKLDNYESLALLAQTTDGFATFAALTFYDFSEQHVVSNILINTFGTWSFLLVKIVLALVIIFFLRKSEFSSFNRKYILLFVMIFGFATGVRDLFSIACHI